jgi:small-conductance mechanosensitive channel
MIEVGSLQCRVQKIGIRGSVIRTWGGADIIVPNSQLISEKVTNWTHSVQMMRIDLPIGLSYDTSPRSAIKLLESVAYQNPAIVHNPPPQGLVTGFGESSINFELRAWTDQFDEWHRIKSELATAVFDAVLAADMTIPFPQREVRLVEDSPGNNSTTTEQLADKGDIV